MLTKFQLFKFIKPKKENSKISTKDPNILLNKFFDKENSSKFKETIIKVKQGQTFSEILDNFRKRIKNDKDIVLTSIKKGSQIAKMTPQRPKWSKGVKKRGFPE